MIDRLPNVVIYENEEFVLSVYDGDDLPTPELFGIVPEPAAPLCPAGYAMTYWIKESALFLIDMWVNPRNGVYCEIEGAQREGGLYTEINLQADFTGTLWLERIVVRSEDTVLPEEDLLIVELELREGQVTKATKKIEPN